MLSIMKERFDFYYIVFMILGIGGLVVGLIDSFVGIVGYTNYFVYHLVLLS